MTLRSELIVESLREIGSFRRGVPSSTGDREGRAKKVSSILNMLNLHDVWIS